MKPDERDYLGRVLVPYEDLVGEKCTKANCVRIPIQGLSTPTAKKMQAILDTIDKSISDRWPVYVHCLGGIGRTGTVVGCWLLRQGLACPSDVLQVLMKLRQQDKKRCQLMSPETEDQQRFVKKWLGREIKG